MRQLTEPVPRRCNRFLFIHPGFDCTANAHDTPLRPYNLPMIILILIAALAPAAIAQTKTFDTYNYAPPTGYSEKITPRFVQFNRIDGQRRYACQLGLYLAQPATASLEQDLEIEWKAVITPFQQITGTPVNQPLREPGLPENLMRTSTAQAGDMRDLYVGLVVLRFPGRYLGVSLTATPSRNADACRPDLINLLRSIRMNAAAPPPPPPAPSPAPIATPPATASRIPTGSTPGLYPGMPGWLPSGAGVPIPDPAIVDGKPVGLWWQPGDVRVYLPNGIRASNPRLGGPRLYDLESQRRQPGANGVGTFAIGGGQIVERYDGFENRYSYAAARDSFQIGGATFRPLMMVTPQTLVGSWRGPGLSFDFFADGTVTYGTDAILNRGRWVLDGYLLQIQPEQNRGWVEMVGYTGVFLLRGNTMMQRR